MPIVKVLHALSASALTTAIPSPARATMRMNRMARAPVVPATGPICVRAISASERPPSRVDAHRHIESCTAPATHVTALLSHNNPGAYPNCAASTGPTNGPCPRNRGEMVPEQDPTGSSDGSSPRRYLVCAGVNRASSRTITFAAMKALQTR